MSTYSTKRQFQKPDHAGHAINGYRSKYEFTISELNPFLVYEPKKLPYTAYEIVGKISPECIKFNGDDAIVSRSMVSESRLTYTPDWMIPAEISATGKAIYIESKSGTVPVEDLVKVGCVMNQYPDLDFRFMLESKACKPGKRTGDGTMYTYKSRGTVAEWLKAAGIIYCIGKVVPREWLNETNLP
ncbi:hypothetical protein BLD44_028425 [Mastigocladus laminosus UU774]|nr:hypothetical protein BLD44_028425 [Mastigocladus laminosus UU774]